MHFKFTKTSFCLALATILTLYTASVLGAELIEDSGAWMQAVAEGSLEFIDSSLKNGRLWLEGQSRFDGNCFN